MFFSLLLIIAFAPGCKKDPVAVNNEPLATKYAKYRTSAYSDQILSKWAANLEKGEPVELLAEMKTKKGKKDIVTSKVKLSDETIVYVDPKSLAVKPLVFTVKNTPVYDRNNAASGIYAVIPSGTVGFVIDEKADWVQVDIGKIGDKQVYGKWVKEGFNTDPDVVADAVSIERIKNILTDTAKGDKEEAMTLLRSIAAKTTPAGDIAKEELERLESPPAPASEGSQTDIPEESGVQQ